MSSYAIQAVSSPRAIIEAHQRRGFEVLMVAISWDGAKALAKSLGMATDSRHLMVVSTMARRLHEVRRAHLSAFSQPTLVVLPAADVLGLDSRDWDHVRQEAEAAANDVVFLHAPA